MSAQDADDVRRPGRPNVYHFSHYQKVAEIYNEAASAGRPPTMAVAAAFDVPKSTAAKWVFRTREWGFLPPTKPGVLTRPTDAYPVWVEMHRGTTEHRRWKACNACLHPWPCEHSDSLEGVTKRIATYTEAERERDIDAFAEAERHGSDSEQFDGQEGAR